MLELLVLRPVAEKITFDSMVATFAREAWKAAHWAEVAFLAVSRCMDSKSGHITAMLWVVLVSPFARFCRSATEADPEDPSLEFMYEFIANKKAGASLTFTS